MTDYKEKFEKMRIAGKLASKPLDMLTDYIKPGVSTDKIDKLGYEFIKDNGGYSAPLFYRGFEKSLCTSLNHVVCHGIPSDRILEDGDAVNVDVTAVVDNYLIEIKNVTLFRENDIAEFPDAVTSRGTKHLNMLIKSIKKGYKPYVLFLTQIQNINNFRIAKDIDQIYFENYKKAKKAGVKFLAYRCKLSSNEIKIDKKINILDD